MLKIITRISLLCLSALLLTNFHMEAADIVSFSADKTKFMEELETFIEATNKKEYVALYKGFETQVDKGVYSDLEFGEIVGTCNDMGTKRMAAAPYFTEYLKGLNIVKQTAVGNCNFMNWHESLRTYLQELETKNYRHYKSFLVFSQTLFNDNALRYTKGGINWTANAPSPEIAWENGAPVVHYAETNLTAERKKIKINIQNTSGTFYPLENKWRGKGGTVSWNRINASIDAVATLNAYEIDVTKGEYVAQDVLLEYPKLFGNQKVKGTFKDKILGTSNSKKSSYPRFNSKQDKATITGLGEGLEYYGGFKLEGGTIEGYSEDSHGCKLTHTDQNGNKTFRLAGAHFSLQNEKFINAKNVEAVLYFEGDSIYHPNINSKVDVKNMVVNLRAGEKVGTKSPFYDSYHAIYLNTQKLNWYPLENKLVINETRTKAAGAGNQRITLTSQNFYDEHYMRQVQNVASYHPIVKLKTVAEKEQTRELDATYFAQQINPNFSVDNIKTLLFDLEKNGFIAFNSKNNTIQIYEKVFRYSDVHAQHTDYDVIKIKSEHNKPNAQVNLETKELLVRGVKQVQFNQSQKVAAIPSKKEITVGKNREMSFDGRLFAGFSELRGERFVFDYEAFKIDVDSVHYLDFFVPTGKFEKDGQPEALSLGSRIEHATGTLLIDAPENKSGREDLKIFPSFKSRGKSYVYYDKNNKLGDAYPREAFHFELEPFFFEGLRNFTPADFEFKGKMKTAGVFPEFEEVLRYQKHDHSLGFTTKAPAEGYPTYAEKGHYTGDISISNTGLHGKGNLKYEATSIHSEDFIFRPDYMQCTAENFDLKQDRTLGIPRVAGLKVAINWQPYKDSMYVQSQENSFDVFTQSKHKVAGTLIYTPGGLKGQGNFLWDEGEMAADLFNFGHFSVQSDDTDLQIKALETDALAFDTKNVNGVMDFEKRIGHFKANDQSAITSMPHNQYETTLNEFEWNLGQKELTFIAPPNKTGTFTALHAKQDGLVFEGESAKYDFATSELNIGGVPYINTADALVYPSEGKVVIAPGGDMQVLENAIILANTTNEFHKITKARVKIDGKEHYTGSGFYAYNFGDKKQEIEFTKIVGQMLGKRTEKRLETRANASVGGTIPFHLSEGFQFTGDIELIASQASLNYKGFARIDHPTLTRERWFSVDFSGNQNEMKIELEKPRNKEELMVYSGIYLQRENRQPYTRLMMPLHSKKDHVLLQAGELLKYDELNHIYIIGDSTKVMQPHSKGNIVQFDTYNSTLQGKGSFDICPNLNGPDLKVAGIIETGLAAEELANADLGNEQLAAKFSAMIDFGLPKELTKIITEDFKSASFEATGLYYSDTDLYETVLCEFVSNPNKIAGSMQQLTKGRTFSLPTEDTKFDFLLTDLKMTYDADFQSFISSDNMLGMGAFGNLPYHRSIEGFVEFKMPASGEDHIAMILTSPSGNWYFFGYKNGILNTISSYAPYNTEVAGIKKGKAIKLAGGTFTIEPATNEQATNFKRRAALKTKEQE